MIPSLFSTILRRQAKLRGEKPPTSGSPFSPRAGLWIRGTEAAVKPKPKAKPKSKAKPKVTKSKPKVTKSKPKVTKSKPIDTFNKKTIKPSKTLTGNKSYSAIAQHPLLGLMISAASGNNRSVGGIAAAPAARKSSFKRKSKSKGVKRTAGTRRGAY